MADRRSLLGGARRKQQREPHVAEQHWLNQRPIADSEPKESESAAGQEAQPSVAGEDSVIGTDELEPDSEGVRFESAIQNDPAALDPILWGVEDFDRQSSVRSDHPGSQYAAQAPDQLQSRKKRRHGRYRARGPKWDSAQWTARLGWILLVSVLIGTVAISVLTSR